MPQTINVLDEGIVADGSRPVGRKLNQLFEAHAEDPGTQFRFPDGTYLIEQTLQVPTGAHLRLSRDATMKLADGAATTADDYLLTNSNHRGGNYDITIEGGVWDGNNTANPRPEGLFDDGYTGAIMHFQNVDGLNITNARLTNAEAHYIRLTKVSQFQIENINFASANVRPNNDGIHVGGNCQGGIIRGIRANMPDVTGDDMVALNADDALDRTEVRGMTNGDINDILIENVEAYSCHSFVRMLCVHSAIRNVTVRNLAGGCHVAAINADGARNARVQLFDPAKPPFENGVGLLENILVENLNVHKTRQNDMALIDLRERLNNFEIKEFQRNTAEDQSPESPTLRLQHLVIMAGALNGEELQEFNTLEPNPAYESNATQLNAIFNPPG